MKNINLIAFTFIITLFISSCGNTEINKQDAPSEVQEVDSVLKSLNINTSTSSVEWKGVMVGIYSHNGFVSIKEGNLVWQGNSITGGSITGLTTLSTSGGTISATTLTATTTLGIGAGWTAVQDGSNNLVFKYSGVNKMKIDPSGNLTVTGDITAFGTI